VPNDLDDLVARVRALLSGGGRVLLGIAGAPGAGKSTLAEALVDAVDPSGATAAWIPMDGFHLADVELDRLGLRERKGAIETFDGWGYLALLRRLRTELDHPVYGPGFERELEQPIAGAMPVLPSARLVVTEGNYLLDPSEPWTAVRAALDAVWFVEVDDALRRERLVARHVRFGKTPEGARAWVDEVDERNAERVALGRGSADLVVDGDALR
jgi:pantothenate kinase